MLQIRPLSEDLQIAAAKLLGEVSTRIGDDLAARKLWIAQQPHLKANMDDQFLIAFLRGCKYSLEKAKLKIDKFFTLRSKFPEMFGITNVHDQRFREIMKLAKEWSHIDCSCYSKKLQLMWLYLPKPLYGNGPRICIMRSSLYPADKYSMEEVMAVANAMQEVCLLDDDYANVNGVVYVLDFEKSTMAHMFQWTPSLMKKMTVYSEEAVPLRPKATHFIKTPPGFEPIFNVIKPMLSVKQQNRLFVHGNKMELLIKEIPLKYLPKEYGGENSSAEEIIYEWERKMDEYSDYFQRSTAFGTDENLRSGKAIDFNSLFGIEGSFRKLNVD